MSCNAFTFAASRGMASYQNNKGPKKYKHGKYFGCLHIVSPSLNGRGPQEQPQHQQRDGPPTTPPALHLPKRKPLVPLTEGKHEIYMKK